MEPVTGAFMLFMTIGEMKKEEDQNKIIDAQSAVIEQQQDTIDDLNTKLIMLNAYIAQVEEQTAILQKQIQNIDSNVMKLTGAHSAVAARDKVNIERLQDNSKFLNEYIKGVEEKTDRLEDMMRIYHP